MLIDLPDPANLNPSKVIEADIECHPIFNHIKISVLKPKPFQCMFNFLSTLRTMQFTREDLLKPVPIGQPFRGTVIQKPKTKSGKEQFYLYDAINEDLVLVANEPSSFQFVISQNAKNAIPEGDFFVGTMTGEKSTLTWRVLDYTTKEQETITYVRANQKEEACRRLNVEITPGIKLPQRIPNCINGRYRMSFPTGVQGLVSEKNIIIDNQERDFCAVFQKEEMDAYILIVKAPLSIFQGFCIGLSTFRKYFWE